MKGVWKELKSLLTFFSPRPGHNESSSILAFIIHRRDFDIRWNKEEVETPKLSNRTKASLLLTPLMEVSVSESLDFKSSFVLSIINSGPLFSYTL